MRGDAVGAGRLRNQRGAYWIWRCAAARIAHRGDVIDIDTETKGFHTQLLLKRALCFPVLPPECYADAAAACPPARLEPSIPPTQSTARRPSPCPPSGRSGSRP